jgi:hypothetical protein
MEHYFKLQVEETAGQASGPAPGKEGGAGLQACVNPTQEVLAFRPRGESFPTESGLPIIGLVNHQGTETPVKYVDLSAVSRYIVLSNGPPESLGLILRYLDL